MSKPATHFHSPAWASVVSRYLIERKQIHRLRYRDIKQRLEKLDVFTSENNLKQRFNQGSLGAQLFTASLIAMGEKMVDLETMQMFYKEALAQTDSESHASGTSAPGSMLTKTQIRKSGQCASVFKYRKQ